MNWFLILVLGVLALEIILGVKRGMVKQLLSFITVVILSVVLLFITKGLDAYFKGQLFGVIIAVVVLMVLIAAYGLLTTVLFPAKLVAKLPIISGLDKILGIVAAVLETLALLWAVYTALMLIDLGMLEQQILEYTLKSSILNWLYTHNILASFVLNLLNR